jgi:uncharacterized protein (DUF433 family)
MTETYIEQHDAGYWIKGTRVSLDSVVYRWLEGLSPDSITECFPALTLAQVYGAIAYYLSHRAEIDAYLKASEQDYEAFRQRIRSRYPGLSRKLDDLVQQGLS